MKKYLSVLLIMVVALTMSRPVYAAEGSFGDYMGDIGIKFVRGLENIVTSPVEIPCQMKTEIEERKAVGAVTGLGTGTIYFLRRLLVGATEVMTFVIPMDRTIPRVCGETY